MKTIIEQVHNPGPSGPWLTCMQTRAVISSRINIFREDARGVAGVASATPKFENLRIYSIY